MTIEEIVRRGRGSAGHWRVNSETVHGWLSGRRVVSYDLYHYSTCMLNWVVNDNGILLGHLAFLGHGSVSDQHGMNIAFRVLGIPRRYDRAGGARLVDLRIPATMPVQIGSRAVAARAEVARTPARQTTIELPFDAHNDEAPSPVTAPIPEWPF